MMMEEMTTVIEGLPFPPGCRWQVGIGRVDLMFQKVRIAVIRKEGEIYRWFVTGDAFPAYARDYREAAQGICDWICRPAPHARSYTQPEAESIAKKAFYEGRMFETMIRNHLGAVEPQPADLVAAALASSRDGEGNGVRGVGNDGTEATEAKGDGR